MKILIIEDDAGIAELFREQLEDLQHQVIWVDNFPDADKQLQDDTLDLMIVDYRLSSLNNAQDWLLERKTAGLPIPNFIVSTGQGDERIAVEMMKLGARDYIVKDSMIMTRMRDIINRVGIELENEKKLKEADKLIEKQLRFTQLLMKISTSFINLPLLEVESAIQKSLNEISVFVKADQSYIISYDYENKVARLDYEWCNKGFAPRMKKFKTIQMENMDDWVSKHTKGEVIYIEDIDAYDQEHVKEVIVKYGIKSLIAIPVMDDDHCVGYVSFDSIIESRVYSESEQNLFRVFTQLLVNIHKRRLQVEALRLSGEKYHLLFQQNPQPMWIFDLNTLAFLEVNDAAIEHYGYTRDEFLNLNVKDIRPKEDLELLFKNIDIMSKNDRSKVFARHKKKNNQLIEVELTSVHVVWNEKKAIHVLVNDITEKRVAQEKLQEKRDILNKVLVETTEFIASGSDEILYSKLTDMMYGVSGAKFVAFNEYMNNGLEYMTKSISGISDFARNSINILGFNLFEKKWKNDPFKNTEKDRESIHIFKSIGEIADKALPKSVIQLLESTFSLGEVVVVSIIDNDRTIGDFVLLFKKGVSIKNREIVELFANQVGQFIVRKQTEIAMRESEKNYRLLFINNPQPMWIYDLETLAFLEVNEAAIQNYGYSRKEFLSMSILDIRPPEDIPEVIKSVIANKGKYSETSRWCHLKKSGEIVYAEITSTAVEFENRPARHVLINDVTKRLKLEEELNKKMTEFLDT
jgi:PAS domain S-box-containing protein